MTVGSKSTHAECKQMLLTDSPSQMSLWAGHLCASTIFINAILRATLHSRFKWHLSDLLPWPLGHFILQTPLQVLHPFVAMFSQWCIFKICREVLQAPFLISHLPFCSLNATTWWTEMSMHTTSHYSSDQYFSCSNTTTNDPLTYKSHADIFSSRIFKWEPGRKCPGLCTCEVHLSTPSLGHISVLEPFCSPFTLWAEYITPRKLFQRQKRERMLYNMVYGLRKTEENQNAYTYTL